ncbi:GNAT family N-acetyltransferase [Gimibacter soli]|uniref:GNAT family N-acetyltransferase n=1 Tax=Gimibacter soli TaxID=3024400 RepID=A0AAF0BMD6_9PROT|nr:GNAT family N-acetyltransferase [Gimibacter soli]WCL54376.1 GNAT family N-acetyltransferase [Gimibacter soli]
MKVMELSGNQARDRAKELAFVLYDCVAGGASVSFMAPFPAKDAYAFWLSVAEGITRGERHLLVAEVDDQIVGTVQLVVNTPPNQPHRADVAKMLVHRSARGKGVGAALLQRVEATALALGRTLLVLDTVTGSPADRLYRRHGWQEVGVIPDYALLPEGGLVSTTVFYKKLG